MSAPINKNCGQCIKFATVKCTWRFGSTEKGTTKPKVVKDWQEFLAWLYDFTPTPSLRVPATNLVFKSDVACADFVPWRGHK